MKALVDDALEKGRGSSTATAGSRTGPSTTRPVVFPIDARVVGPLVDVLANQVCRVNLHAQCQRGPDVYPFAGRKTAPKAPLSVSDALRCFSIRSMVAAPEGDANTEAPARDAQQPHLELREHGLPVLSAPPA